jgi:hypothetical protein
MAPKKTKKPAVQKCNSFLFNLNLATKEEPEVELEQPITKTDAPIKVQPV